MSSDYRTTVCVSTVRACLVPTVCVHERKCRSVTVACTCLCAGHQVSLALNDGNGVLLHGGRPGVAGQSDVGHHNISHRNVLELHTNTPTPTDYIRVTEGPPWLG